MARIAVIGAGINGVMAARALAQAGHGVEVFERDVPMAQTSQASTKLLHGGLRYLETGDWRLVYEALAERSWWLEQAPHLTRQLPLLLPVYKGQGRARLLIKLGLSLYDRLAPRGWPRHHWWPAGKVLGAMPELSPDGLVGAFEFTDGQMDDLALGQWAADQLVALGATIHSSSAVTSVDTEGRLMCAGQIRQFDLICNLAGPWAAQLLKSSGVSMQADLRLVRGAHLVLSGAPEQGLLLQAPQDQRVFFVLPGMGRYAGMSIVGTTEAEQSLDDPIRISATEQDYLLAAFEQYFGAGSARARLKETYAGVRPLVRQSASANVNTREHHIETQGRLISVFGGKWTTSRMLGLEVAQRAEQLLKG
jgi:glycerol-3-phosphate dehydrogenase